MDNFEKSNLIDEAKRIIFKASEQIKSHMQRPYEINTKQDRKDLVTEIDESTEKFIIEKIRSSFPDHKIMAEEGTGDDVTSLDGTVWIIDPIDGTMNFIHQKRFFAISIGVYHNGEGIVGLIYDVMDDTLYEGVKGEGAYKNGKKLPELTKEKELKDTLIGINSFWSVPNRRLNEEKIHQLIRDVRGTRSYGSAALEFAYIAEGIIDAYITMRLSPWDIAAGLIIINEVGGKATRVNGEPLDLLKENSVLAANEVVHSRYIHYIEEK
ncbi:MULTISPECIES: inositol monophosphatase family protein [Allobacillus]|uniref:inositol-phosphate phosphatase n=1 Tax=Allobacillus salarius TaxID=1955272 RepID=A0A556PLV8_9BACI|nr:inositol monophosphatase family protein [Allobacillus salarius]TSJ65371.1 inositol monophosphatase family protein [Allobacillus salarius]